MMSDHEQFWDFAPIINPQWRIVAKEILLAMLAPQYEAVLECAHALRAARSPRTCFNFLQRYAEWFNWLTEQGITALEDVTQEMCERYLEHYSWSVPVPGRPRRRLEPYSTVAHVRILKLIAQYEELLSSDSYETGFVPWKGKTATQVVGYKSKGPNLTPPVPDSMLQPLLATCLYLVNEVGPHLADLMDVARTSRADTTASGSVTLAHLPALRQVLALMRANGEPLPAVDDVQLRKRTTLGQEGPLKHLGWEALARTVGARRFGDDAHRRMIPELTTLAAEVGFQSPLARQAAVIPRMGDGELIPWTSPLAEGDLCFTVDHAGDSLSGGDLRPQRNADQRTPGNRGRMPTPCCGDAQGWTPVPARQPRDQGAEVRRSLRRMGGHRAGGRAVALAERLVNRPAGGALFGTIDLSGRLKNLRGWLERTGSRERWGLPVIPQGPLNARMLRRTLSLAIAERPGGLLAAKIALKHISVATTEGYAARPGGSQRLFHAEIEEAEEAHHVQLTVQAFRDVQAGRMPAGPGARGLIEAFHHVDAQLKDAARTDPKILKDDRHLENLLRKQAKTLHVGPANFCWFRDPSKALCLRLAGTPNAAKPLVGMCDSARCPQATHHPCHRPVWAGQATAIDVFIESPRVARCEKARLVPERDRALRVVAEIDATSQASAPVGED